jgi:hypothetical protein
VGCGEHFALMFSSATLTSPVPHALVSAPNVDHARNGGLLSDAKFCDGGLVDHFDITLLEPGVVVGDA